MKLFTTILFMFLNLSIVFSQKNLLIADFEPGKAYGKCLVNGDHFKPNAYEAVILKITPTKWAVVYDTIYYADKPAGTTERFSISDPTIRFKYKTMSRNCIGNEPENCLTFVVVEVPANYRTITYRDSKDFLIIERKKIVEHMSIQLSDEKFPDVVLEKGKGTRWFFNENETMGYIKTKAGKWTGWSEVWCTCEGRRNNTIRIIQNKLKERGYETVVDNILGAETKSALTKFQKDHGLPVGQLDMETLSVLGVVTGNTTEITFQNQFFDKLFIDAME